MKNKYKLVFLGFCLLVTVVLLTVYLFNLEIAVLNPKGIIGSEERSLLINATGLMFVILIPVFILTIFIIWRYRASNTKAWYRPNWDNNPWIEFIWWGVPFIIVTILSVMTWKSCHSLDPFKPLTSDKKPVEIQVVALQWKWLFIYPEYQIATVNFVQFPENTPLNFQITADAPMNSFWIPKLGGQIYAMPGMSTKLHLIANEEGVFSGSSANLSGEGFAGMRFVAKATSEEEFDRWISSVKRSKSLLTLEEYNHLVEPSKNDPESFYVLKKLDLYDHILMKYMMPMP